MHVFTMSKKILIFYVSFFMIFILTVYPERLPKKLDLKLFGGLTTLSGTDLDANDDGWTHLRKISAEATGGTFSSDSNHFDRGWELGGEIVYSLSSRIALSGGVGYITGENSSEDMTAVDGVITGFNTTNLKAKTIPVSVGIYTFLPVSSKSRFSLGAGVGYYFTSFTRDARRENNSSYWIETSFKGSGGDLGFHGGIGFEYSVTRNVTILIEGFGRYAKISGFEGTRTRSDSNNFSDSFEGQYFALERFVWTGDWQTRVSINSEPPSGDDVRNVRDLDIDFSGFSIRLGLKIKLF